MSPSEGCRPPHINTPNPHVDCNQPKEGCVNSFDTTPHIFFSMFVRNVRNMNRMNSRAQARPPNRTEHRHAFWNRLSLFMRKSRTSSHTRRAAEGRRIKTELYSTLFNYAVTRGHTPRKFIPACTLFAANGLANSQSNLVHAFWTPTISAVDPAFTSEKASS